MKYLIDGYNVLFQERDSEGSLEEQRIQLFEKLNNLVEVLQLDLLVVFDSHNQVGEVQRHHVHSLEVVYTEYGQTADEYIIEHVENLSATQRNQVKVVTSDRGLTQKVRLERVETMSVSSFFKEIGRKLQPKTSNVKRPSLFKPCLKGEKSALPSLGDNSSWIALFEARMREFREETKTSRSSKLKKDVK